MMKKNLLLILCLFALCGCAEQPHKMTEAELSAVIAYRYPKPPTVKVTIDSDELVEAFGAIGDNIKITERNIDGWHKIQVIYDYPGGVPENWTDICAALAAGTSNYKTSTTAELMTPRGALLASAMKGELAYDAFEHVHEPIHYAEHDGDLSAYDASPYYVSNRNKYYHIDGTCGPRLSRPYVQVEVDDAVDERLEYCPICSAGIPQEVRSVELRRILILPPDNSVDVSDVTRVGLLVYVSDRSHTIHKVSDCSGMKHYSIMTQQEADALGYAYCPNCW